MSSRARPHRLLLGVALAALVAAAAPDARAQAPEGKALFEQSCASCHTIGGGDTAGPDLEGVVGRAGEERTRAFIATPEQVIASGDPEVDALVERFGGVQMPNLGLSDAQVDSLVAYLAAQEPGEGEGAGGDGEEPLVPSPGPAAEGDAGAGRHLYTGEQHFENGGPSCMSCHQLSGADIPVGGRVGPDLTDAYEKYGGATGIIPVLASMPFPSMQPVYRGHELTSQEQADLAAFLATTVGAEPRDDETWLLVLAGIGVTVLALGLMLLVWPRRRLVVRRDIAPAPSPRRH
jgi:mono/diheme cytochrome c family protein